MVDTLDKWLKPAEYFRRVHSSLIFDFSSTYISVNGAFNEFDEIIKEIKSDLQELRNLREKSDKGLFFGLMSYFSGYQYLTNSRINLERIIAHRLFVESRWHLNNPELDPDIRKKLEIILEKTKKLEEDENVKKAYEAYDKITKLKADVEDRFKNRLKRKIRKEVGRYDIDGFLLKHMLKT